MIKESIRRRRFNPESDGWKNEKIDKMIAECQPNLKAGSVCVIIDHPSSGYKFKFPVTPPSTEDWHFEDMPIVAVIFGQ